MNETLKNPDLQDEIDTVHEPEGGCGGEVILVERPEEAILICSKCGQTMHMRKLREVVPSQIKTLVWGLYSPVPRPHGWASDLFTKGMPLRKFNTFEEAKKFADEGGDPYKTFFPRPLIGAEAEALLKAELQRMRQEPT